MEQPASQASSKIFSKTDEQRYQQLTALYIDGKTNEAEEIEFQELRKKKIAARDERERCIQQLIKDISARNISLAELVCAGLELPNITELYKDSEIMKAAKSLKDSHPAKTEGPSTQGAPAKKREVNGYIKSIHDPEKTGVWRAGPPNFFKEEGGQDAYIRKESIDQWLVDPTDKASKIKLLKKLHEKTNQAPTSEQLGEITPVSYEKG